MYALQCMIKDDARNTLYQEYVTMCVSSLTKMGAIDRKAEWNVPSYYEMVHSDIENINDSKSGSDIINDIISRLS